MCVFNIKYVVHLHLTESGINAMKDDDRAELLWHPENATTVRNQEGNKYWMYYLAFVLLSKVVLVKCILCYIF